MSGFLVTEKPCSQCPFVYAGTVRPGRVKDILRTLVRKDSHFVCHKSLPQWPTRITTGEAACRGYWNLMLKGKAHPGQMVRIAERLDCVEFVKVEDESARPLHTRFGKETTVKDTVRNTEFKSTVEQLRGKLVETEAALNNALSTVRAVLGPAPSAGHHCSRCHRTGHNVRRCPLANHPRSGR